MCVFVCVCVCVCVCVQGEDEKEETEQQASDLEIKIPGEVCVVSACVWLVRVCVCMWNAFGKVCCDIGEVFGLWLFVTNYVFAEPEEWEDFDGDDDVVDLRAYAVLGGVFHFNLLHLPPQPKVVKDWTITQGKSLSTISPSTTQGGQGLDHHSG